MRSYCVPDGLGFPNKWNLATRWDVSRVVLVGCEEEHIHEHLLVRAACIFSRLRF